MSAAAWRNVAASTTALASAPPHWNSALSFWLVPTTIGLPANAPVRNTARCEPSSAYMRCCCVLLLLLLLLLFCLLT